MEFIQKRIHDDFRYICFFLSFAACSVFFSDGNYVSTNSSWATIHNDFGETWAVQEEDWMFSFKIANLISKDIQSGSPYTAKYTAEFESDELKAQAEEVNVFFLFCYRLFQLFSSFDSEKETKDFLIEMDTFTNASLSFTQFNSTDFFSKKKWFNFQVFFSN